VRKSDGTSGSEKERKESEEMTDNEWQQ